MDNYRPPPGTAIEDLDTPCLLVDMDAVDNNYRAVARTYRDSVCKMRQHTKNVKSPRLAHMQIEAGGTVGGVCTAKLAEAEVMVEGGIRDILIPNQVATRDKMARMCALARRADIKVCVDNPLNVMEYSDVAQSHGTTIGIMIEVDTSMGRAGTRTHQQAIELAKLATELPGVEFRGIMSHQHLTEFTGHEDRILTGRKHIQMCLEVKSAIEEAGMPVEQVSSGETFSYDTAATMPGVTDVEGGTYALMGTRYDFMEEFQVANKVLCSVISTPRPGVAVCDVGSLALSLPAGHGPSVEGRPGVVVERVVEDCIVLRSDADPVLQTGDKVVLLPWYQDLMINRWDQFIAVRDGVVEGVWDIPGRGCYH